MDEIPLPKTLSAQHPISATAHQPPAAESLPTRPAARRSPCPATARSRRGCANIPRTDQSPRRCGIFCDREKAPRPQRFRKVRLWQQKDQARWHSWGHCARFPPFPAPGMQGPRTGFRKNFRHIWQTGLKTCIIHLCRRALSSVGRAADS